MTWLIALLVVAGISCALFLLAFLATLRVAAIRRARVEPQPEAFGDWPNVPERFAPPKKIAEGGKDGD